MALGDVMRAVRTALISSERVERLGNDLASLAETMDTNNDEIHNEIRELDRRLSRLEGALDMLRQGGGATSDDPAAPTSATTTI